MAALQKIREQTEQQVMVHLLSEVDRNPSFTQRGLAAELGIALGLMNQYLKRCVTKGWIRASQVSPRRIRYFLTPEGFKEKSHMVTDYVARSLTFFRDARCQCEAIIAQCQEQGWHKIALMGEGDLADIVKLVVHGTDIQVCVLDQSADLQSFDAVLITEVQDPQGTYDRLKAKVAYNRLLTLDLLHISRHELATGGHP